MHWSENYIGLPFRWGGYTREGVSCWGLMCLVQREVFGRAVPHQTDAVDAVRRGERVSRGIWQSDVEAHPIDLTEAREGDVLHMLSGDRRPTHVGTFVAPGRVLHIERGTASIIEKLTSPRCAWRPIQAYRLG